MTCTVTLGNWRTRFSLRKTRSAINEFASSIMYELKLQVMRHTCPLP